MCAAYGHDTHLAALRMRPHKRAHGPLTVARGRTRFRSRSLDKTRIAAPQRRKDAAQGIGRQSRLAHDSNSFAIWKRQRRHICDSVDDLYAIRRPELQIFADQSSNFGMLHMPHNHHRCSLFRIRPYLPVRTYDERASRVYHRQTARVSLGPRAWRHAMCRKKDRTPRWNFVKRLHETHPLRPQPFHDHGIMDDFVQAPDASAERKGVTGLVDRGLHA